jgi:hypothetical protein
MDLFTLGLWIVTIIWFVMAVMKDKKKTFQSVKMSSGMMKVYEVNCKKSKKESISMYCYFDICASND